MDLVISNTAIITGDGTTFWPSGQIGVAAGRIAALGAITEETLPNSAALHLDAQGATSFPGLINAHAHGCVYGPAMPSGSKPLASQDIRYFRNRHLLDGTTTLINVCGLALPQEIDNSREEPHALQIAVSSAHTPNSIAAAQAADGSGLAKCHLETTVDRAIEAGAVALGEGGGGQTLGGGAQDYGYLPRAILEETGVLVEARDARRLKELVLGRALQEAHPRIDDAFIAICEELGLLKRTNAHAVAATIANCVMKSVHKAQLGMAELVEHAARTGLPAILHTALPSARQVLSLARATPEARIIAAHCNHPSFTAKEAVATAQSLREAGVAIDASTLDCVSTHWRNTAENLDALIGEGLVDTLSTDFAGGHWDGILEAVHRMVVGKQLSAPQAIALATGNVARTFPAFRDRGVFAVGKRADITIADSRNLSRVRHVIIGGKIVVRNGVIV